MPTRAQRLAGRRQRARRRTRRATRIGALVAAVSVVMAIVASATVMSLAKNGAATSHLRCHGRLPITNDSHVSTKLKCRRSATTTTAAQSATDTVKEATTTATTEATTTTTAPTMVPSGTWGCAAWPEANPPNQPNGETAVELNNDVFAPEPGFHETICGNNTSWYVDINAPDTCGGCVQAYPSLKYRYDQRSWLGCCGIAPGGEVPVPTVSSWTSTWNVSFPANTNAEAAHDLWFGNNCGTLNGDVMVWEDTTASRGTGGGPVVHNDFVLDGRSTTVIKYPGSETIYKFNTNEASGSINLMAVVTAELANGDLRPCNTNGITIVNADFGFETAAVPSTDTCPSGDPGSLSGRCAKFAVNDFHFDVVTTDGVHHT